MEQNAVIAKLREHAPELNAAGLRHIRLFGSIARGESTERSDVDLLVEFDPAEPQTLVSVGHLQSRLAEILQTSVDVSVVEWMREPVRSRVMSEAVLAF